ncbi:MAG: cytochrome P450, partial [Gammaproteobacteria bacterium]|nr:cytochrome P450 [Gammaproteobacteria bacterium]
MDLPSTALKITSLKGLDSSSINAFTVQGVNLIVLNNDQHISVFHANCPHQGSDLSTARLQQGRLVCPMHQWQFDQLTGERVDQPGSCLQAFDSLTYNGDLYIDAFGLKQFQQFRNSNVFQSTGPADQRIKHLPGPKALPLLGNMLQLKISVLHLLLRDWSQRYGKIFRLKLPMGTAVVLSDSICIRQLLRERPHSFRRPSNFPKLFSEINGHGVFSEEGDNWQRQRRLLVPALNLAQLDDFFPKMNLGLERLYQKWSNEANQQKVSNICSDFANLTGDIATHVTLGHDINMQQGKSDPLQSAIRTILQRITERSIAAIPYWRFIKLPKDRAVDRALVILHNAVNDFINHAKQRMTNQSQANSFLDALVSWQDEQGKTLSDKEIQGNVLTMIAAGGDTTAHTMSWLLYFMCLHPHIQERMQHEVDQFSGDPLKLHSADQFKHFPYIKASVQEAMRLKPVAPVM